LQAGVQPFGDLVGDGVLQGAAAGPGLQHGWKSGSLKKKCWESLSTGVAPEIADFGSFRSVGA
jgi:hypothetical protein